MGNIASDLACAPCPVDGYVIISEPAQRAEVGYAPMVAVYAAVLVAKELLLHMGHLPDAGV